MNRNHINSGINGNGRCAKRLRRLAKKDKRKAKKFTEHREKVKDQLGKNLWKHGILGLSPAGKPRGVKKTLPDNPPLYPATIEQSQS